MEGFRIDLKTFWAWLCLTNALKLSESKYKAGLGMIIWGQNPLSFMIPIKLYDLLKNSPAVKKGAALFKMASVKKVVKSKGAAKKWQ